jgi:hypothetical protein
VPKYADCNNCGAVHKVYDICKSTLVIGQEDIRSKMSKSDFKFSLSSDVFEVLQQYNRELPDFEYAQFITDNEKWGSTIVLSREELDGTVQGKTLRFVEKNKLRIESYLHREEVDGK